MVTTESVTIKVPVGMSKYLVTMNPEQSLLRNAAPLLYPYYGIRRYLMVVRLKFWESENRVD